MRLAIEHAVALQNSGLTDGLREMTFPRSPRTEKQGIVALPDEATGGQIEDQAAVHFRVEGEVEVIESRVRIAEARLLAPAFEQPVTAAGEFIRHQAGDQIDRRHGFGLGLAQTGLQHRGYAAESELPQSTFQFRDIHSLGSLVLSWIRSR